MSADVNYISEQEQAVIDGLRDRGFCVVIWTPDEVGEADTGHLEDIVIERGNNYLGSVNGQEED